MTDTSRRFGAVIQDEDRAAAAEVVGPAALLAGVAWTAANLSQWLVGHPFGAAVVEWLAMTAPSGARVLVAGLLVVVAVLAVAGRQLAASPGSASAGVAGIPATMVMVVVVAVIISAGVVMRAAGLHHGPLAQWAHWGGHGEVELTVVREPRPIARGWQVIARVDALDGQRVAQRGALVVDDPPPLGSRWHAQATARPLPDDGYGRWLAAQHAAAMLDVHDWRDVQRAGLLARSSEALRARIRQASAQGAGQRAGGLLAGFVIGDTRGLDEPDLQAMQATSLTHLTAVSGPNVRLSSGCAMLRPPCNEQPSTPACRPIPAASDDPSTSRSPTAEP